MAPSLEHTVTSVFCDETNLGILLKMHLKLTELFKQCHLLEATSSLKKHCSHVEKVSDISSSVLLYWLMDVMGQYVLLEKTCQTVVVASVSRTSTHASNSWRAQALGLTKTKWLSSFQVLGLIETITETFGDMLCLRGSTKPSEIVIAADASVLYLAHTEHLSSFGPHRQWLRLLAICYAQEEDPSSKVKSQPWHTGVT